MNSNETMKQTEVKDIIYPKFTVTVYDGIPQGTIHHPQKNNSYDEAEHGLLLSSSYDTTGKWNFITDMGFLGGISVGADGSHATPFIVVNPVYVEKRAEMIIGGLVDMEILTDTEASLFKTQVKANYGIK